MKLFTFSPRSILALVGASLLMPPLAQAATTFTTSTLIQEADLTYENQDIIVQGCTVTINGQHAFNSVQVIGGGLITHSPATPLDTYSLRLTITGALLVDAASRIDATGCGYLGNLTLGNSTNGAATGYSGGSYGGLGFSTGGGSANGVYGDYRDPNELGSGGAGDPTRTGAGGGLVRLTVGSAQIDGAIVANGLAGVNFYQVGAPGSGGGIRIDVGTLSGSGKVSADGGTAAGGTGSGSGGRVAIYYQNLQGFNVGTQVTAHGGSGGDGAGAVGTVYLKQSGVLGKLLLASHGTAPGVWTPLGNSTNSIFQADTLEISGTNVIAAPPRGTVIRANAISVLGGAVLTVPATTTSTESSLQVTVTNTLLVDANSRIDVSGCGYLGNYTLGNLTNGAATGLSGGSYGGFGFAASGSPNAVYGDFRNPNELGSGGAGDPTRTGAGGGLLRLSAGSAQIDGAILANGLAGFNFYAVGGPGSGGGIRIDVGTLSGTGRVSADGGAAAGGTGSGGGGRVAIYYQILQGFDLTTNVTAHAGAGGNGPGSVGTVYLKQVGGSEQLLIASHATPAAVWTPLGLPADTAYQVEQLLVSGDGVVAAPGHQMPLYARNLSVLKGAVLTHLPSTQAGEYALFVTVTNSLLVDQSSKIDVSGRGYPGNYTISSSLTGPATGLSSASYGGLGVSSGGGSANAVYGDYQDPNNLGSGGAGDATRTGAGGGLLRLSAGSAQIDGAILANGIAGVNFYAVGGPGSGGGIRVDVGTLTGTGRISADGGAAAGGTGSGGGGRVAVYFQTLQSFDVTNNVTAHAGSGGDGPGAVGTVFLKQSQSPGQLLLASHGTPAGVWTPLGMQTDTAFNVEQLFISGTNVMAAPIREMPIQASSISLSNGAILTHQITTTTQEYSLRLTISDTLLIDPSSLINVSGRGYLANHTVGNSTNGAATGNSGGSFGGLGFSDGGTANAVYGDYHNPSSPGSGGGGDPSRAGAGGGLVRVTAGKAQIDGLILANGTAGWNFYQVGAAGSGGGIFFDVGTLSGSGRVSADGGAGGGGYGSGGGGRVAVFFKTLQNFDLASRLTARGGNGGDGAGGVGTVYVKQNGVPGELRLVNLGSTTGSWTPLGNPTDSAFLAENLTISGTNTVAAPAGGIPIRALSISLLDGAVLTVPATTTDQERSLSITVTNNLRVDARSRIDVSGTGYRGNYTLGNQTAGGATGTSGGSYGGLGYYQGGGSANSVYGDYRNPNELGSGGAGDPTRTGAGGGLVRITADTAQIDGAVYANGIAGWNFYQVGGGGSGGGIRLDVNSFSGTGQISADGGNGGSGFGAGSGGRIAIYYNTVQDFDLDNKVTSHGGTLGDSAGAVGTIYLKRQGTPAQLLVLSHGITAGMWTPLGSDSDVAFVVDDLVIAGTNVLAAPQHEMPIQARSVTITNSAGMTHQYTTGAQEYSLRLTISSNLLVDASSKIDASGRGYLGNYTLGNTTDSGAGGFSGGSYGGLGFAIGGGQPNHTYGDERNPVSPGSGGGGDLSRTGSGGGVIRITADTAEIDGVIKANGLPGLNFYQVGGAGSGGSILLNAGIITGNGILNANGGAGGSGYGAGGGGRVAVYNWNIMSLAVTNVTAAGGTGDNGPGQPGTVIFSGVPVFVWENDRQFLHGTESIAWNVLGVGQGELHVQLSASRAGTVYPIGTSTNSYGTLLWDTRTVPDGAYVLNAVYNDLSGQYSGLISRDVLVNNALVWHSGSITNSQTWQAGVVHVVDGKVFIGPGGNVTIQPGAILKFTLGSGISVKDGAILNALATPSLPIILTSFKDDTAGGDSNLDGDRSLPQPGDWAGISVATTGQFNHTSSVDFRYLMVVHGGDLAADEGWEGTFIHIIKSTVTVPSGVTLTIAPGAVLKFASGAGLSVSSGGRLNALGTLAQPITFTSTRDDSVGGDSNNDSHLTQPAPGDWVGLNIGAAVANLKYCNVRYGGNTGSGAFASGMFIVNSGKLALTGCLIETALYDGLSIYGTGGSATLTNCILRDLDRAIWAWGGGNVQLLNSTFDENVAALVQHGGATVTAENCIIANSVQGSVTEGPCTLSFCDLWSKYPNSSNPGVIGQNGNNSADPRFVNASQKDYRLRYGSPCIDAADSTLAPLADFMGAPRYTDPRAINRTGRPDAKGTYADLGPFEFVESASSAVDLVASDVSGPAQVGAGDTATLRWTVSNRGSGTATGPWHDAVYLIPLLGGSPVFVTEVLSGEGTALGTGQSLAVSARILAVGVPEGQYQWQIQANSRGDIFEGTNWTNNTALASSLTLLTVPQLVIGGPVANNQFTAAGQSLWYKFLPQTNSDVQVNLQATASAGSLEIYLGRGYIPTRDHFDSAGSLGGSSSASVIAPNASSQPYYVTVYAQAVPPSPLQFSISSSALAFSLTDAAPNVAGTGGSVTLKVSGGRLRDDMTFSLVGPGGTPHPSLSAWKAQDASVYATFDTTALPVGLYSLLVNDGASNRSLSNAVSLVAASPGAISYNVVMPSSIRWGQIRRAVLNYRNTGNTDVLAPVITINAINGTLVGVKMDTRSPVDFGNVLKQPSNTAQLLGINPAGPAGVLPPGFEGAFYFDVMANPGTYSVSLNVEEMLPARAMDWAGFKNSLKPLFLPADAWEAIYGNFTTRVGATTDQYRRLLSDDANYLSRLGHYTADVGLLLGFEIQKANAFGSIGLRYALGIFGRGFADPFNMTAQTDANGNVMVGCPSGFREFTRVSAGVYQAGPGDAAVLTDLPGGYRLEEADGVVTVFGSGGKINYIEQPNGWRVTLNYSGGRLAGISNSHGDALTYAYNGLGRVATITDPQGRVTTLAYDAAGEHLLSATDPAGTTQFTYLTGQGASREHAISAITFPDGRHLSLQYDSLGRISRQSGDQGANALNFAYDNQAGVTIADGAGGTFDYEFDDLQNLCTVRDPLGRRFTVAYDRQLTPKLLTDAEGNSQAMSFDGSGNLTSLVDWLGLNYTMTYSPANTLVGYANPAGVPLSFTFDQGRNLTGALYPDQTRLGFQRDQLGQLTAWSNRRGQTMRYNLNASGQLANKQFSSGPQENFTYDNHRNLVKIIDAKGTNTYTFDGADRLTGVHYPSGRSLTYAYDAYGRRTQLLADDGYTVKYNYDAGGRLSSLLDKNNALIVSYSYDAAGRLTREDKGNQTYTTYAYDLAGQVLHLINHRKDNSVLSRFDYTYDLVGRPATVATLEGTWEYQYDANGQLTTAVFASTNSGVPGQTNAFVYDSAGNRTQALVNGTATSYLADRMDRYLAVGAARYSYDADGNLTSITDETGVTSFTYDELNRLTSVTSPTDTWSYEYDAFNFRRASVHNGVRTEYLIDPLCQGAVVGDYVNGALSGHYAQGIGLVGRTESDGTARYYNFDIIGNTTEFTGPNGAVLNSYRYRPFGDLISSQETAPNRFSYGGRWGVATESSGLSLMGARYYRPVEGRFLTEEPVGRRYPNAYAYAYNTPVLYNDPTGLDGQNGFLNWLIGFIPFSSTFTGMQATWTAGQQGHAEYQSNIDALSSNPNAPLHGDSVNGGQVGGMYLPALQQAGGTVLNSQMNVVNQSFSSVQGAPAATSPLGITQTGIGTGLNAMKDHYMNKKPGRKIGGGDGKTNPPGKPPGPPNGNSANGLSNSGGSTDPNDLIGPIGFGDGRWVPAGSPMLYTIDFENLPTVLLPAQSVDIENQLDPHLDWSTFELQQIGFNRVTINVPPGLKSFTTSAVVATDPNPVSVVVSFNPLTGMLKSHLESTDPVTGLLVEDPLAGFLPPNDAQHRGEGFLSYTIRTASALSSDSQVHNQASIVFDVNAPLRTPTATNSIDVSLPSSGVAALPAISTNVQFRVSWSGFDLGSGIAAYNVFVSVDNGPWSAWRISTPKSSELYTGQPGRTYSFYSIVEDNVGHSELKLPHAEATTLVSTNASQAIQPVLLGGLNTNGLFQINFTGSPNLTNYVEISTNLLNWTQLAPLYNTSGSFEFEDTTSKNVQTRFYRVRVQGP